MITAVRPQKKRVVSAWVIEQNLNSLNEAYRNYMTASAERRYDEAAAYKINLDTLMGWFVEAFIALGCDSQSFKLWKDEVIS